MEQEQSSRQFVPSPTDFFHYQRHFYQQIPFLVYSSELPIPWYNSLLSQPNSSEQEPFLYRLQRPFRSLSSANPHTGVYQAEPAPHHSQAPREDMRTSSGTNSSPDNSDLSLKQEEPEGEDSGTSSSCDRGAQGRPGLGKKNPNYYWNPEENRRYY
jgi:hypothetical protein